jgi:hypothetical protein
MLLMDVTMTKSLLLMGLASFLAAPAAGQAPSDPLVCFRDADGHAVRPGQDVRDREGRLVGWVSVSQCGHDRPQDGLYVRLDNRFGGALAQVDASQAKATDEGVVLRLGPEEVGRLAMRPGAAS